MRGGALSQLTDMHLKDKNRTPSVGFVFYFKAPNGTEVRVPVRGSAPGVVKLEQLVKANFQNIGMEIPGNLSQLIEHQICIRHPNPLDQCWEDGFGDHLHYSVALPIIEKAQKAIKKATGKASKTLSKIGGCSGCKGTKVYDSKKRNLGRAGILNHLSK